MLTNERHLEILNLLSQTNYLTVEKLAKLTNYSVPTIRRDLALLSEQGYIIRNRGGALLPSASTISPLSYRVLLHKKQKAKICAEAVKMVKDYMTIFIDESTTILPLIPLLKQFKNITVITNGLTACQQLNNLNISFYCTGGKLTNGNGFTGMLASNFVKKFNTDILFFSTSSIYSNGTISEVAENEAYLKQSMIDSAKKVVYMFDKSKLNKDALFNIANLKQVDYVITNADINDFDDNVDKEKIIHVDCPDD